MFFNDWLARRRIYTPDQIAVVDLVSSRRVTYQEMNRRACALASWLHREAGISRGNRVACLSMNRLESLDLFFACGKIGAILVPLNYRLPGAELTELIQDCRPRCLMVEETWREFGTSSQRDGLAGRVVEMNALESIATGTEPSPAPSHQAGIEEIAMILYTSGTTGKSKGAMISWRQIHWNAVNTTIGLQLTGADVSFLNTPLYHTGGWHVLFTPLMHLGGRVVLQKQFDAAQCNDLIAAEGVTILFGIPTTMRMMMDAPNFAAADFRSVRFAICGGEPCPLPVIRTYEKKGVPVRQGYGLTEAGPNCFSLPAEDAIRKEGSVGFPNFHIETRIEKENGAEAGPDEVGELLMRGPHLFSGYWNNPEATGETLAEGWVRTGDLFRRDAEGYHYVVGRRKEMFVSGGENVYPAQVEKVLQRHPSVAQAAVIGVPNARWGEVGCACVELSEPVSVQEIGDWCRRFLAGYQCPKHVFILENLTLGHSGKIDKQAIRQRALEWIAGEANPKPPLDRTRDAAP